MNKHQLMHKTENVVVTTQEALRTVYEALNQGQRKKILKDEAVAELFRRFHMEVE